MTPTRGILSLLAVAVVVVWNSGAIRMAKAQPPSSQAGQSIYVVTHVDILPSAGGIAEGTRLLRDLTAASRKEAGNVRFEVLQQDGRRNHLTIVEVWQSREAFDTHTAAEHTKKFREKIQPMLGSPFDERLHILLP